MAMFPSDENLSVELLYISIDWFLFGGIIGTKKTTGKSLLKNMNCALNLN